MHACSTGVVLLLTASTTGLSSRVFRALEMKCMRFLSSSSSFSDIVVPKHGGVSPASLSFSLSLLSLGRRMTLCLLPVTRARLVKVCLSLSLSAVLYSSCFSFSSCLQIALFLLTERGEVEVDREEE